MAFFITVYTGLLPYIIETAYKLGPKKLVSTLFKRLCKQLR